MKKIKKKQISDDEDTRFKIMFILIHAEEPQTLTEISKQVELQPNLVFYHLKKLIDDHLVLETDDKKYMCQPILLECQSEDLDALIMVIIRLLARELVISNPTEKELARAVLNNLKVYMNIFELEIE